MIFGFYLGIKAFILNTVNFNNIDPDWSDIVNRTLGNYIQYAWMLWII
jgi:hypothetical protein